MGKKSKIFSKEPTRKRCTNGSSRQGAMKVILSLFLLSFSLFARPYPPGKIGCWSPVSRYMKLECVNQRLRFDVLRRLFLSGKQSHLKELRQKVKLRAGHFLQRGKTDYESILALMVFPIPGKKNLLKSFKKLEAKKALCENCFRKTWKKSF